MIKAKTKMDNEMRFVMNLKSAKKIVFSAALLLGMLAFPSVIHAADNIDVTIPTERAIYQRDNENKAQINVTVQYNGKGTVQAQVMKNGDELSEWISLTKGEGTTYSGTIANIPGGGWYQLAVKAVDSSSETELARATVEKFGVGEVFITGGQSNSCNFGGAKTTAKEDIVSAYNPNTKSWQHCEDSQPSMSGYNTGNEGGSAWPSMGDALVAKIGVPVGFVSTGVGSAKIEELRVKHYAAIRSAITDLKPYGYRAFLLHQGEADTPGTKRDAYLQSLQGLIAQTREDAGYDLNWVIAQVSYAWSNYNDTKKMESMKETQRAACNDYNIFVGPTTDDLQGEYRRPEDNLHLSEKGLIEHGKRWADVVYEKMLSSHEVVCDESLHNGTFVTEKAAYYAGDTVSVSAVPNDGYYLKMGTFQVYGQPGAVDGTSFTMHAEKAVLSAEFVTYDELANALRTDLAQAESINLELYDDASKTVLASAIQTAKQVSVNGAATAEEIQRASVALLTAKAGLVEKEVTEPSPTPGNTPIPQGTPLPSGTPVPAVSPTPTSNPVSTVDPVLPKKGTVIKKGALKYTITSSTQKMKTVSVKLLTNKKKTSVIIPKTISYKGHTYKVTEIGKKAFYQAKKLKTVKISSTTIKKIGKDAFKKVNAKIRIKVPSSKLKSYKKLLKGKGLGSKAKIVKL